MKYSKLSFSIAVLLIVSRQANAELLTLAKAIEIAQSRSPDIQQLEEQYYSAAAKKRLALAPSEPTLSVSYNDMAQPFLLNSRASNVYSVTQTFGFPGRAFLNRSALSDQADAIEYQLKSMRLQVSINVKQAYYALALAFRNELLNTDQRLAYERILAIAKRRYETGVSSQVDYLNSQLQLLQNDNDLADLQASEHTARVQLNALLKNPSETALEISPIDPTEMKDLPPIEYKAAEEKMLANRNEIKSAQSQVSAASKNLGLAWMSLLPDFQVMAGLNNYNVPSASPVSSSSGLTQTYMAGVQIQVPLWFLFNEREAIVGSGHDRAAADANLSVIYEQSRTALVTAIEAVNANKSKVENYQKHMLPMAEQALNVALISYGSGKIDFQSLSDTATARRQIRQAYASAIVNFLNSYATYGQLIGEEL